jgi:radical SAM superfamily enzyme YgiQ (UPF0313 family)
MKRLDQTVNTLSVEELRNLLFDGSPASLPLDDELDKYQKLASILEKHPIRNRNICLVTPPQLNPEVADQQTARNLRYQDYPPTGLLWLSAAVRKFMPAWTVQVVDLNLETLKRTSLGQDHGFEAVLQAIPNDCDLYGVSVMFESTEVEALHTMEHIAQKGRLVISGGFQSTVSSKDLLDHGACSMIIKKEGEPQLVKLLSYWETVNSGGSGIPEDTERFYNLDFKHEDAIVSFEEKFENPISLDIRKEYDLIDLDQYTAYGAPTIWTRIEATGKKWATLLCNRGCRGRCTFCQVSYVMGQGVRSRSVSDVIDEILFLYHEQGVRHLDVIDDDFLGNPDLALELLRAWADLKLDMTYAIGSGVLALQINEDLAQAMSDSGCIMSGFGIESGNAERLKSLRKPTSLKKIREGCEIFKQNHRHIWLQGNFIIGFPSETYGELMDTFNYAKSLEIDYCQSSILRPILGTPIYDQMAAIEDKRVISFGSAKTRADTAGRDIVSRGYTFDDAFDDVIDFRKVDLEKKPNVEEIQQFQIYFNTSINLVGSINLKPGGMPEKIRKFTDDVLKAYPMDAISWGVNAKACKLLGEEAQFEASAESYRKAAKASRYWSQFFEIYDIPNQLGIPL